jgi:hypothetical protein
MLAICKINPDGVTGRSGDDAPLAALDILARVKATTTPISSDSIEWLTLAPALELICKQNLSILY